MRKGYISIFCVLLLFCNVFLLSSCCNDDNTDDIVIEEENHMLEYFDNTLNSGEVEFTNLILNFEHFERIIPLGQLNPPGHTFPTDHVYFVLTGSSRPIYAPTRSKVLFIESAGDYGDGAIRMAVTDSVTYYLGHIFVNENLKVGDVVEAGTQIGISGNTVCVDFGVLNKNIENNFINSNYPITTLYGDKPLTYYSQELRSQLYSLVKPASPAGYSEYVYDGGVTDGNFVYDVQNTLCGNWFKENSYDNSWYEWEDTLAFSYNEYYTNQIRIASGLYGNAFAINNGDNPIKPDNVNVSTGVVTYYLYNANNTLMGEPTGSYDWVMLVQMVSNTRIKLEIFNAVGGASYAFTSAALYYTR